MKKKYQYTGLTLIELIVAIAITSVVGLGLVSLQYILSQNQIVITQNYRSLDEGNSTISQITKEIRRARQSDNGAYLLNNASDQEIIFYSDIDLDGKTEWVRYYLDGTDLVKEVIAPTGYPAVYDTQSKVSSAICRNIGNGVSPLFYYYDENWPSDSHNNPLTEGDRLSKAKTIKIVITVNEDDAKDKKYSLETFVQIRSAKENL